MRGYDYHVTGCAQHVWLHARNRIVVRRTRVQLGRTWRRFVMVCWLVLHFAGGAPHVNAHDGGYAYRAPPSIPLTTYQRVLCQAHSPMCADATTVYQLLVDAGLDPALELAHAAKESSFVSAGIGRPTRNGGQYNPHGVRCNTWDGGGCRGRFSVYTAYVPSVQAWIMLMTSRHTYLDAGLTTLADVVPVYCPASECDVDGYITQLTTWIDVWRGRHPVAPSPAMLAPAHPLRDPDGRLLGVALMAPRWITGFWTIPVQLTNYRPHPVTLDGQALTVIDGTGRTYQLERITLRPYETVRVAIHCAAAQTGMQLAVQVPDDPVLLLPVHANL